MLASRKDPIILETSSSFSRINRFIKNKMAQVETVFENHTISTFDRFLNDIRACQLKPNVHRHHLSCKVIHRIIYNSKVFHCSI